MALEARSPWEFRLRALIAFIIYFLGFSIGYAVDGLLGGRAIATYVQIGRTWGETGIRATAAVAALLALCGFLVRFWGSSYHRAGVVYSSRIQTDVLTASGPYRYVRNPLYFGNLLQAIAIGSLGPPPATLIIFFLFTAFMYRLIFLEEARLRGTQGQAYERYCASVPRLVPRLTPAPAERTAERPNVLHGFVTELGSLGFAIWLGYLGFVDPNEQSRTFAVLFFVAMALFIVGGALNRRLSRAAPHGVSHNGGSTPA